MKEVKKPLSDQEIMKEFKVVIDDCFSSGSRINHEGRAAYFNGLDLIEKMEQERSRLKMLFDVKDDADLLRAVHKKIIDKAI